MSESQAKVCSNRGIFPAGYVLDFGVSCYDELHEVASFWQMETRQLQAGRYSGRLLAIHSPRAQLAVAHHGLGTSFRGGVPKGTLVVSFPMNEDSHMRFRGQIVNGDEVVFHDSRQGLDTSFGSSVELLTLCVDRELLESRAAELWQTEPDLISSGHRRLTDGAAASEMRNVARQMLERGLANPVELASDSEGTRFEAKVIDAVLFQINEPRPIENSLARRWLAKRGAALLEERFREPITMVDLCATLRASRRTLHMGFLEVFGIPPMRYLQIIRLNAVRRELRTRHLSKVPVTRVATDCGFSHLGRFSVVYRDFFGVSPSQDYATGGRNGAAVP